MSVVTLILGAICQLSVNPIQTLKKGWRMVKSETRRDTEILVRNSTPRLFGKKFQDSKKVKTNHAETRLQDLSTTFPRFQDPAKIFRDPRFLRYHLPPIKDRSLAQTTIAWLDQGCFKGRFYHSYI